MKTKIIFEVEKINTLLIRKVALCSETEEEEFIMNIYRQFGFRTFNELKKWINKFTSKLENEGKQWMNEFYMSINAEANLLNNLLKFYNGSYRDAIIKKFNHCSLNYGVRNEKKLSKESSEVKNG